VAPHINTIKNAIINAGVLPVALDTDEAKASKEYFLAGVAGARPEEIMGPQPSAELVIEHREPRRRERLEIPVDPVLLQAGDHNGSTFYQHEKFLAVVRGTGNVEVTLTDGINAALIGLAAEHSASTSTSVDLTAGPYRLLTNTDQA